MSRGSRSRKLENESDLVKGAVPPTKPANRISAFHCGERASWYSSVRHLSILKARQALSVSALEPWRRRAKNPDLTAWVRVSVESSPKPLGNPSTAPKHPFLEVSLSLPPTLIFAASGIERLDSLSKPVGQKFVGLSDLDRSFPSLFLEETLYLGTQCI